MISERLREPHGSIEDETTGVTRPLFDPAIIYLTNQPWRGV